MVDLNEIITKLDKTDYWSVDIETPQSLDIHTARVTDISIALNDTDVWHIPFQGTDGMSFVDFRLKFQKYFEDPKRTILGWNSGCFDLLVLKKQGVSIKNKHIDVQVAKFLCNETRPNGLKDCVFKEFGINLPKYKDAIQQDVFIENNFSEYSKNDSKYALKLFKEKYEPIIKANKLERVLYDIDMPALKVIGEMMMTGAVIDTDFLSELNEKETIALENLELEVKGLANSPELLVSSPDQVSRLLFEKMAIKPLVGMTRGKKGLFSTDDSVLKKYAPNYELVRKLLAYRKLSKNNSTYTVPMLEMAKNDIEHRIYPDYNFIGTVVSRFSCNKPNLQNIPRPEDDKGVKNYIRRAFIAPQGKSLLVCDFNQLELRTLTIVCKDPKMVKTYKEDGDIHSVTMKDMDVKRPEAKVCNFNLVYRGGFRTLMEKGNFSEQEAKEYVKKWHKTYPAVKETSNKFQDAMLRQDPSNIVIKNLFGRQRRLFIKNLEDDKEVWQVVSMGWHFLISSTAMDIVKIAMGKFYKVIEGKRLENPEWNEVRFTIQVHDEVVMEVPDKLLDECKKLMIDTFEHCCQLIIPLKVSCSSGKNWEVAKG